MHYCETLVLDIRTSSPDLRVYYENENARILGYRRLQLIFYQIRVSGQEAGKIRGENTVLQL